MKTLPDNMTIREAYEPAMAIIDQAEADEYFEALVQNALKDGTSREQVEAIERKNLLSYSVRCDNETRERVRRLFNLAGPWMP